MNGWVITGLELIGLSVAGIAFVAVPVMGIWMGVGLPWVEPRKRKRSTWQEVRIGRPPGWPEAWLATPQ